VSVSRNLQTNAASETQASRVRRKVKDRQRRAHRLMRQQLSTADGRELIWNELAQHGLYEDCSGDVATVYAFLGRRREGLRLLADVMRHPDHYLLMQQEAMQRDERDAAENQAAHMAEENHE
jgi:hypothetical protein